MMGMMISWVPQPGYGLVWIEDGRLRHSVIDGVRGVGLCGSGLLDLTACLLNLGAIDESGLMEAGDFRLEDSDVMLTQKDVREVQLAKAAIRAGIELLAGRLRKPLARFMG